MVLADVKTFVDWAGALRGHRTQSRVHAEGITISAAGDEKWPHVHIDVSNDGELPVTYLHASLWRIDGERRFVEHLGCEGRARVRAGESTTIRVCLADTVARLEDAPVAVLAQFTDARGRVWVRFNNDPPERWGHRTQRRYAREHRALDSCEVYGSITRCGFGYARRQQGLL